MKKISKALVVLMLMMTVIWPVGCKTGDVSKHNTHEYVDLGLPSGTLWATCNVGAKKPEDLGKYFAWGETSSKRHFSWKNYKYAKEGEEYDHHLFFTKYCDEWYLYHYGNNGFSDGLSTLEPDDDVATANWGFEWCTPSVTQWDELIENTDYEFIRKNGVYGILFTSHNGNSLFLPAGGTCVDREGESDEEMDDEDIDEENEEGEEGYGGTCAYWSRSLLYGPSAWSFLANIYSVTTYSDFTREYGLLVRPVRSINQIYFK